MNTASRLFHSRSSLDGEYFRDGIDVTADEFYRRLVAGAKGGSTRP